MDRRSVEGGAEKTTSAVLCMNGMEVKIEIAAPKQIGDGDAVKLLGDMHKKVEALVKKNEELESDKDCLQRRNGELELEIRHLRAQRPIKYESDGDAV